MPESAYSARVDHGWRRDMFRRQTDLSWPLIAVLVIDGAWLDRDWIVDLGFRHSNPLRQ